MGGCGGWPAPDALFHLGSNEAEDPGVLESRLQPCADADAVREGPGGTTAGPGGESGSGHPCPCTHDFQKPKKVNCGVSTRRLPGPCGGGACEAGAGRGWRPRRSAFLAVSPGHIWPTCGSHYSSQGLRARLFLPTGWRGWGWGASPSDARLQEGPRRAGLCLRSGFRNPAVRQRGQGAPLSSPSPCPSQVATLSAW